MVRYPEAYLALSTNGGGGCYKIVLAISYVQLPEECLATGTRCMERGASLDIESARMELPDGCLELLGRCANTDESVHKVKPSDRRALSVGADTE